MAERNYRRFKKVKFKNVTMVGEYEKALSPWTINFLIGFKIELTKKAEEDLGIHDLRQLLSKNVLGKVPLERAAEPLVPVGYGFWGMRHAFEHHPSQIDFGRKSDMQIEFFVTTPPNLEQRDDKKGMQSVFDMLSKKFAGISNLQSTKYWKITPAANVR